MERLTISKIATTLGVEQETVKKRLNREDEDLMPYVTRKGGEENGDDDYVLDIEGLPLLIKKLSFNLPTSEIIENLACQVLHLTALEQNNISLTEEIEYLANKVEELRKEVAELRKIEEERSRSLKYRIGRIFRQN